jgi:glycosyltransferase involved in cell wall biosynthesis
MKVAQIVCVLPPYGGGIGMVAHSYADQLFERGYDVVAFVPHEKTKNNSEKKYPVKKLFTPFKSGNAAFLPQLIWQLWKFDILHLHYPFFGASFFVLIVRILRGKKISLITNYHMDVSLPGTKGLYVKIAHKFLLPTLLKYSDKIIVSSLDYVENSDIQEFYFKNKQKFLELPFGVPRRYSPCPKDAELLKKYNLNKEETVVLFVGSLDSAHYFKGVDYLIKALPLVNDKNTKILIVGTGNLQPKFEKLATDLDVKERVIFAGYVTDEDLPKHYNLANIFCLPSTDKSEAFGIVLLEAMACGKPLIASNLKGVRSVVDQGINGVLVQPKNSQDIASKINYFVEDKAIAKIIGERGVLSVEEKYRWSKIVNKLIEVYKKLNKKEI